MPNIDDLHTQLKASLTSITGVGEWFTIEFSMMPTESPKGFLYPLLFEVQKTTFTTVWLMAIKVTSLDIDSFNTTVFSLIDSLIGATANPEVCLTSEGNFQISEIDLELPKSYTNENIRSNVTAYQTVIGARITLQTGVN